MITEHEFYEGINRLNKLTAVTDFRNRAEKKKLKAEYNGFVKRIETEFHDKRHNFLLWLLRKPCSYRHPMTGNVIDVYIGDDAEAIFYFLGYCLLLDLEKPVDDDYTEYLTYLIARSNTKEDC